MTPAKSVLAALGLAAVVAGAWWIAASRPSPPAAAPSALPVVPRRDGNRADAAWGSITGRVSDLDGTAVADALVVAQDLAGFGGLARTAADGTYRVDLMPVGRVEPRWPDRGWPEVRAPYREADVVVAATADGFTRSNVRRVAARRGAAVEAGPLALYRGGRVAGRVVDDGGREVAGRVRVVSLVSKDTTEGMQAIPAPYPEAFADAGPGRGFAIGPLGPGRAELFATVPGVGTAWGTVDVEEGCQARVDLVVRTERAISGRVEDATGTPVAACRVVCRPDAVRNEERVPKVRVPKPHDSPAPADPAPAESPASGRPLATDTDSAGRFWFYGPRDGATYTVAVVGAAADAAPRAAVLGVAPGRDDLLLVTPVRFDVSGTVRDAVTGAPVGGAVMRVFPAAESAFLKMTRPLGLADRGGPEPRSAGDGTFRLPEIFAGSYVLHTTRAGFEFAETPLTVGPGAASVDVALVPAARLEGTVALPDGSPSRGARLVIAAAAAKTAPMSRPRAGPWSGRLVATSDDAGAFRIDGLPADTDLVLRASDGEGRSARVAVRLLRSERRREDVRLADPATLSVRLRPRTSGALSGHPVRLRGIDDPDVDVAVESDADGVARVTHLPPGRYEVLATDPAEDASSPDVALRVRTMDLSPGAETDAGFTVPDFAIVRGRVLVDGAPVRAARVGFGPLAGTADHWRPLLFEARAGRYEGRVPPGRYHVHVAYPGFRRELDEPVDVPAAPEFVLDFELPRE